MAPQVHVDSLPADLREAWYLARGVVLHARPDERGPELRFESRAGFIANHNALRGMEAMAQRVRAAASGALRPAAAGLSAFLPEARDPVLAAAPSPAKSVSYSPSYSISVSGGGDPVAMRRLIVNELAAHERRVQVELRRLMHD